MSTRKNIFRMCFAAALAAGLTACGGGGKKPNTAPSLTLGGTATITEGTIGSTGLKVTATDDQGDDITVQVSDARFEVDADGNLTVVAGTVLDYEMESSIAVDITASDGALEDKKTATVSVGNVDDTVPTLTAQVTQGRIVEGKTGGTGVTFTADDNDGMMDSLTLTANVEGFSVASLGEGKYELQVDKALDYEVLDDGTVSVVVTAKDGAGSTMSSTLVVSVENLDDTELTLNTFGTRGSIVEGETGGTGLTFMADDNDGMDNLVFTTSVEGFSVQSLGGNRYELKVDTALDREALADGTVSVTVTATDDSGFKMTPTLTIAVGNKDDTKPELNAMGTGTIDENGEGDTGITFRPTDADGDAVFSFFLGGTDRKHFSVVPAGYQTYALQVSDAFDYENDGGTVSVTVTVVDSAGMHDEATFEVTVEDVNDVAPTVKTTGMAAINEEMTGSTGLTVDVDDVDTVSGTVTWKVDDPRFTVTNGMLALTQKIDYDGDDGESSVTVNLTANDGANDSMQKAVTVTINAVNDNAPMVSVDVAGLMSLDEGTFAAETDTGVTVAVSDGDGDTPMPTVSDSRFAVKGGKLVIAAGSMFDYEMAADQIIALTIDANDGVNDAESQSVTVTFGDVNDNAPELKVTANDGKTAAVPIYNRIEGDVSANELTNHMVKVSDEDSHDLPVAMVSDDRFFIDANGYLQIKAGTSFDFETAADKVITLDITADDGENAVAKYTITVNIANRDEAPVITGDRNPSLVMGPYGDGHKDVTTLTAEDPDNPDTALSTVHWTETTNPNRDVWTWTENKDGDKFTLGMKKTFLGKGGPDEEGRQLTGQDTVDTADDTYAGYTGYTADDAATLKRHVVDADDAELDERAIVRVRQTVDTITTDEHLATYRTYSVQPTTTHINAATGTEKTAGKPGSESFVPRFDDLTNNTLSYPTDTKKEGRLLTDAEIHAGITNTPDSPRLGGTNYAKKAARDGDGNTFAVSADNIDDWYKTGMVSPSDAVPMEPAGLDIVTDTRAVNISTGGIAKGQELAIRYRFTRADTRAAANAHTDVALVDSSGMVLEEYRGTAAYTAATAAPAVDTTLAPATGTDTRTPIDVDVTMDGASSDGNPANSTLNYAKYGLWSYNNARGCSTCPMMDSVERRHSV